MNMTQHTLAMTVKKGNTKSERRKSLSYFSWTETDEYLQTQDHTRQIGLNTTRGAKDASSKSIYLQYKYYISKTIGETLYTFAVYNDDDEEVEAILFSSTGMCFPLFKVKMTRDMLDKKLQSGDLDISNDRPHYIIELGLPKFLELETRLYSNDGFRKGD